MNTGKEYIVDKKLGEGAQGIVYRVAQVSGGEFAALKIAKPGFQDSLDLETATYKLNLPGVVKLLGRGTHQRNPFIVLQELIDNPQVRRRDRIDPATALNIFYHLLGRLKEINRKVYIVDIKSGNVMLDMQSADSDGDYVERLVSGSYKPRFTDLGAVMHSEVLAQSGGRVLELHATAEYVSPLSIPNLQPGQAGVVNHQSDVYSLTFMLYTFLTGQKPYAHTGLYKGTPENHLQRLLQLKQKEAQGRILPIKEGSLQELYVDGGMELETLVLAGLDLQAPRDAGQLRGVMKKNFGFEPRNEPFGLLEWQTRFAPRTIRAFYSDHGLGPQVQMQDHGETIVVD